LIDALSAAPEWQPEISPDGKKVCFTYGDFGAASADIHVANIDGSGEPFEFNADDTATPIADYNCAWSPNGKTIGFTRGAFSAGNLYFGPSNGAGIPGEYGNNDPDNFDGNLDWSRAGNTCQGKVVTILGTAGRDNLKGTAKRDVAVLLKGKDRFRGGGGRDIVCGGPGNDQLGGGAANDILIGGPGDDDLAGGAGRDHCVGGPGKDSKTGCE
jgi:Ca2+-binding RTX toxin-like protein